METNANGRHEAPADAIDTHDHQAREEVIVGTITASGPPSPLRFLRFAAVRRREPDYLVPRFGGSNAEANSPSTD